MSAHHLTYFETKATEDGLVHSFQQTLREDYVARALQVFTDGDQIVRSVHVNSADLGTARWHREKGLVHCRAWERPEQSSGFAHHYTAALDGKESDAAYAATILEDCLKRLADRELAARLQTFCEVPGSTIEYAYEADRRHIEHVRPLSTEETGPPAGKRLHFDAETGQFYVSE